MADMNIGFYIKCFLLLLFSQSSPVWATPQIPEEIMYKGKLYCISLEYPLERLFIEHTRPDFRISPILSSSNNQRGYLGRWRIEDEQLFLEDIQTFINGKKAGLPDIFPEEDFTSDGKVKAKWFSHSLVLIKCTRPEELYESSNRIPDEGAYNRIVFDKGNMVKE